MLESLSVLLVRDISKIQTELGLYSSESAIWNTTEGISNSAGNLALHVAGNLQYFIGAILGETGYVRERELEFSSKNIPLIQVTETLEKTKAVVSTTLGKLNPADLQKIFSINVFSEEMTTECFLLHLLTHTSYHLGQINYHRRLMDT